MWEVGGRSVISGQVVARLVRATRTPARGHPPHLPHPRPYNDYGSTPPTNAKWAVCLYPEAPEREYYGRREIVQVKEQWRWRHRMANTRDLTHITGGQHAYVNMIRPGHAPLV